MFGAVPKKLGVREGSRAILLGAPSELHEALERAGVEPTSDLTGGFDHIHVFVTTETELEAQLPQLKAHLNPTGALWVSWPRNRKLGTDLGMHRVIRAGSDYGLVESRFISIDRTWSALRFTHPRQSSIHPAAPGRLRL